MVSDKHCLARCQDQSCALAGLGRVGSCNRVLLVGGHPAVVVVAGGHLCPGQCQGLVVSSGQPASTETLDNLVGSYQLMLQLLESSRRNKQAAGK